MRNTVRLTIALLWVFASEACAQNDDRPGTANPLRQQVDSALTARYYRQGSIDTAYIIRPKNKWTITARLNISGAKIKAEGYEYMLDLLKEEYGVDLLKKVEAGQSRRSKKDTRK